MATLFAYHKTHRQGPFLKTYYFTERKHPSIGDNIYVISGDSPRRPRYFLEGLFLVCGIGRRDGSRRELLLNVLITPETPPCINDQAWFGRDKKEFRNIFVSGLNLNPVPVKYELRFKRMLAENPTADELYPIDAINDIGSDHPERIPTTGSRYLRDPRVRTQVLRRAKGRCEYCDEPGFICRDGSIYLES